MHLFVSARQGLNQLLNCGIRDSRISLADFFRHFQIPTDPFAESTGYFMNLHDISLLNLCFC